MNITRFLTRTKDRVPLGNSSPNSSKSEHFFREHLMGTGEFQSHYNANLVNTPHSLIRN